MSVALTSIISPAAASAQNITHNGPGDYTLTRATQVAGGPRTVDITTTSGNATIDLSDVTVSNPFGTYAFPGTAIGVNNQGFGTVNITSGSVTTSGTNQIYAIEANSASGAIAISSGSISAPTGSVFASGRAISAISTSGPVTITSDKISTDNPTGIYARGSSVSVTSKAISIGGASYYSFDPTAAIYAKDSGGGVTVTSTSIFGNGIQLNGIFLNGSGKTSAVSDTISLTGIYSRGIASYGSGDVAITSKNLSVAGYGGAGIWVDARLNGAVSIDSDMINSRDFATAIRVIGGSAPITVTSNTITASGDFAGGINLDLGTGTARVNSGSISTDGYFAAGISLSQFGGVGGPVTIVSDSILTNGGQSQGISAEVSGPLAISSNSLITTNGGSTGLSAYSSSGAVIINSGTLTTRGAASQGIVATTNNGDLTIVAAATSTSGGADLYSGSAAITASARGNLSITAGRTITTGSQSSGIYANGTAVTITANSVSTSGSNSAGIYATGGTISIATGVVSSTAGAITAMAVGNAAVIVGSATSVSGNAISVRSGAAADVTVNQSVSSATAPAVTVNAGTTASFTLGAFGQLASGTQIILTGRTGESLVNNGTISGTGGSAIVTASGGPLTFTNNGVFTGLIGFTEGADAIINAGSYRLLYGQDFRGGTDSFANSGVLAVLPGTSSAGTVTLTDLETFNNSGSIDLRNGHTGDVLALPGTFNGTGGSSLTLDVNLGTSPATTDRLTIGGAATGSTAVTINRLDAGPAVLSNATGTTLVTTGAGSSANAFVIDAASQNAGGIIQYGVVFNPGTNTFNLVSAPGAAAYRISLFGDGVRNLWLQSVDAWSAHMRELRDNIAANGPGGSGGRFWFQGYGQNERRNNGSTYTFNGITTAVDLGYDQDYYGFQLGMDLGAPVGDEGGFNFGVTAGYQNSTMSFRNTADAIKFNVVNGGVYASFASGIFFVNALGKYDYYWGENISPAGNYRADVNGLVWGAKVEAGLRFGQDFFVEPAVSVSWTNSDFDDLGVPAGNFAIRDADGVRGKAGARIGYVTQAGAAKVTIYGGANYVHEFRGRDDVVFTSGGQSVAFRSPYNNDYVEGTLGVNLGSDAGRVNGFFEGRYADGKDYDGFGARGGMRVRF